MVIYRRLIWGAILLLVFSCTTIPIASAETTERSFLLESNGSQSFETLIQQAGDFAQNYIAEYFDNNPEVTEISLMIVGERNGQIVPLLRSRVTRSQWQQDSRVYLFTKYFARSEFLLGFSDLQSPQATSSPAKSPISFEEALRKDPAFRDD
ncbi:MAG: hypothetical protein WA919_15710 [Coleofasciculaceae cyanobacterium]